MYDIHSDTWPAPEVYFVSQSGRTVPGHLYLSGGQPHTLLTWYSILDVEGLEFLTLCMDEKNIVACSQFNFCSCGSFFLVFFRQSDLLGLSKWENLGGGGQPFCKGPHWHAVLLSEICISKEVKPNPLAPRAGLVLSNCGLRVCERLPLCLKSV